MSFLKYVIMGDIYPILDGVLTCLTASDVGSLLDATGTRDDFRHGRRYLNPLRDLEPSMSLMNNIVSCSSAILMIGDDVPRLMERILRSEAFWSDGNCSDAPVRIWVVAILAGADVALGDAKQIALSHATEEHPTVRQELDTKFRTTMYNRVLQQIHVSESAVNAIGYADRAMSTRVAMNDSQGRAGIHTVLAPLEIPYGYCPLTVEISGVGVHVDWEPMYKNHIWYRGHSCFPYVDVATSPCTVRYTSRSHEDHDGICLCIRLIDWKGAGSYITLHTAL